jgi:Neocarzinostatin family
VTLVACLIGALSIVGSSTARAAVAPTLTVTPSTGLGDGQVVQVTGTNFSPTESFGLTECESALDPDVAVFCDGASVVPPSPPMLDSVAVGSDGSFTASFTVKRTITVPSGTPTLPPGPADCTTGCEIRVVDGSSLATAARASIGLVAVQLTISIMDQVTREVSTNLVLAQVSVTCNTPSAVDLQGFITLPDRTDLLDAVSAKCTPDAPALMFFEASNSTAVPLGDGSVSLCTVLPPAPVEGLDCVSLGGPFTTAAVRVVDFATVQASVLATLADSANTAFRAQFAQALRAALDEDPIYRAEFIAALQGH